MARRRARAAVRAMGVVAAGAAVVDSARRARRREVTSTEALVFRAFNERSDSVATPAWIVMQTGSFGAVPVTALALATAGRRCTAGVVTLVGTAMWLGAKGIKPVVGRGRPADLLDGVIVRGRPQTGLGYPSGHAAVVATLAMTVSRSGGGGREAVALALAGVTGACRLYVGAHLPLDVVGGLGIGALAGGLGAALADRCGGGGAGT